MNAKHLTIALMALGSLAAGCDNISEDDRYIKVEKPTVENPRNLLIMEFTGNSCKNCPTGASQIEKIKNSNPPGRVISVGLHPEGNPNTEPVASKYTYPEKQCFWSKTATELYKYYDPSGFPSAIFNGLKKSMSTAILDWFTIAAEDLQVPAKMTISASTDFDPESRELTVSYEVDFGNTIVKDLNLSVWVVENKIMGTQTMADGKLNPDYEHNHVLRESLNGAWGEPIGSSFDSDSFVSGQASGILDEKWVAENCEVVVFVYRDEDKGVEQATSAEIEI